MFSVPTTGTSREEFSMYGLINGVRKKVILRTRDRKNLYHRTSTKVNTDQGYLHFRNVKAKDLK